MSGFENRRRDGRQRRPARLTALAATAVALPLLALGWTTAAGAQSSAPVPVHSPALPAATAARLQQVLDQTQAQDGFPGVIAGVWSPKGHWIGTAGTQGPGQSGAPTAGDLTRIGSLTKTMTATVLLQLAQRKKLSLDDPISKYVPGLPNGKATLR
ncbi:MAG TPA: serine hydrolase domain-containing protein, partial [Acidimicrobiales bacterium]|nr:serine hydrolase domain-containing protein [Acidimicrobiales bacterium]